MAEEWTWKRDDEEHGQERPLSDRAADEVRSWFGDQRAERRRMIDEHAIDPWKPGPYKGVGPRGWRRSDETIRDEIAERMAHDEEIDARDVEVTVTAGEVVLQGSVGTRAQRRRAEDVAWSIAGVRDVQNRLGVRAGELGRPAA